MPPSLKAGWGGREDTIIKVDEKRKLRKSTNRSQHGQFQKSSMTLNPFEPLPIEMSLCNYENLLVLGASMLFKYHICSKNKHKEKSNSLKVMNRNILNRHKSMKFLHKRKMKFWTISYMKECCYAYKIYTKILLHIGNYNIFQ